MTVEFRPRRPVADLTACVTRTLARCGIIHRTAVRTGILRSCFPSFADPFIFEVARSIIPHWRGMENAGVEKSGDARHRAL